MPGDVLAIEGIDLDLTETLVIFRNIDNSIRVRGQVLSVTDNGPEVCGNSTTLLVRVPTGAPSGFIEVASQRILAGNLAFEVCPNIVGVVVGNNGDLVAARLLPTGQWAPAEIVIYGHGVESAIDVVVVDSFGTETVIVPTPGLPAAANYQIPAGLEGVRFDLPTTLFPECLGGVIDFDQFEVRARSVVDGQVMDSNRVTIPFVAESVSGFTATITGATVSSGVRAGHVRMLYNLCEEPASSFWSVAVEYLDPTSQTFLPCTEVADAENTTRFMTGNRQMASVIGAIVGPGHPYEFVWDSAADLPAFQGEVQVRIRPNDPQLVGSFPCDASEWNFSPVVIDNTVTNGSISEEFDDLLFADFANSADWGGGSLSGVLSGDPVIGTGSDDVVLLAGASYLIDTDALTMTGPGVNIGASNNPGDSSGEFHLRSFEVTSTAQLVVQGTQPLIIHCSGTGSSADVVARIDGVIDLSGQPGQDAVAGDGSTAGNGGAGGVGGPGGGNGGDGGSVDINASASVVLGHTAAEPGGGQGGEAGQGVTWLRVQGVTVLRSGSGGGGGHAQRGGDAMHGPNLLLRARNGRGGQVHGDAMQSQLSTGGGGGGGGALPYRPTVASVAIQTRNGGGGGGAGGSFELRAVGSVSIGGQILAMGGAGGSGNAPSGGQGGGGSGGSIVVRATGTLDIASSAELNARGGDGASSSSLQGGSGSDGRILLQGSLGAIDAAEIDPEAVFGATLLVETGDAADGTLALGLPGVYEVDTDSGIVTDPNGQVVIVAQGGAGEFRLLDLLVADASSLRARGANALVLRVQRDATIEGSIDVSGFESVDSQGGAAGAGGGAGGATASNGALPLALPAMLVNEDPLTPVPGPLPFDVATVARGGFGQSTPCNSTGCAGGGGGGGGFATAGLPGTTPDSTFNGAGGTQYGLASFINPLAPELLVVGGGGGAGGGIGNDSGIVFDGTGGGGGGGALHLVVGRNCTLGSNSSLLSLGGDAVQAESAGNGSGGNGGGGAGGGILIQVLGSLSAIGPRIAVAGGRANQVPQVGGGNGLMTGGDGSRGRIRIETSGTLIPVGGPFPFSAFPEPVIGPFETAAAVQSEARSLGYPLLDMTGGVKLAPLVFASATLDVNLPVGTNVATLFQGAAESRVVPGQVGEYSPLTAVSALASDVEFVRVSWLLFANPASNEVPEVLRFGLDFATP